MLNTTYIFNDNGLLVICPSSEDRLALSHKQPAEKLGGDKICASWLLLSTFHERKCGLTIYSIYCDHFCIHL
jgi:hypothetical protein